MVNNAADFDVTWDGRHPSADELEHLFDHVFSRSRDPAARMLHEKIGSLVVIKDGKLVGILTESDLMRVAYAALRDGFDAQKLRG